MLIAIRRVNDFKWSVFHHIVYLHNACKDVKGRRLVNQGEQERVAAENGGSVVVVVVLKYKGNNFRKKMSVRKGTALRNKVHCNNINSLFFALFLPQS